MRSSERRESFVAGFDGRPFAHEIPPEVETYLKDVESGRKAFCRDQKRLAAYVRRCFAREEIYVHREQLRRYLSLQKYFPYDLFPWEVFYLALHLCTYYVADNTPRWDDLFLLVGRGSGKNGYLAFEDFCALSPYNGIRAYHIDICANNEDQARTSFDDIWRVLEDNREALSRHFTWNKEAITCRSTGAQLRFRTNSPRGKDGLRSGKVDFDEVHEYENYANIEVYTTGFGKKPHPRRTFITSNGFVRDGVLDAYLRRSEEILSGAAENAAPDAGKAPDSGGAPDSGWLPFLCRLDAPEEVDDPAMWHKANPSLEYLPALQREIRKEYAAYRRGESALSFLAKRMNVPRTDTELHVTDWENLVAASRPLPELTGAAMRGGHRLCEHARLRRGGLPVPRGRDALLPPPCLALPALAGPAAHPRALAGLGAGRAAYGSGRRGDRAGAHRPLAGRAGRALRHPPRGAGPVSPAAAAPGAQRRWL